MKYDKSLEQVWEWKDAIYNEVKDLPVKERIEYIKREAKKAASFMESRLTKSVKTTALAQS
jgi:hypothetical protein